jgi:integrase/recombinase XerC
MNNIKSFHDYLLLEKNYSQHTVTAYLNDIGFFESFLANEFEDDNLIAVNYNQIRSWIVSLSDDGISNASINRKIAALKSFYKFLLKTKQLDSSPLLKHKALKSPKKIQIPFSEKELDMVLNQITYKEGFEGVRDKLIVDLFYTTGIRRTELIHLKTQNIDLSTNTIKVLGKRNKERIIPILPIIKEQVQKYVIEKSSIKQDKGDDYFFILLNAVIFY